MEASSRQLILKPQDLVVAVKLAVNHQKEFRLVELADELSMPLSAVHGSIKRCEQARLVSRSAGSIRALRKAVKEFAIHGAKYSFPGAVGTTTRGVPTSIGAPVLAKHFDPAALALVPVWPDPSGQTFGLGLQPIHPSIVNASKRDPAFYDIMASLDALRVGAARERELAIQVLEQGLS